MRQSAIHVRSDLKLSRNLFISSEQCKLEGRIMQSYRGEQGEAWNVKQISNKLNVSNSQGHGAKAIASSVVHDSVSSEARLSIPSHDPPRTYISTPAQFLAFSFAINTSKEPTRPSTMPHLIQQHPILPWEITDFIIDHLHNDLPTLGVCSSVCSDWLSRSRYHTFSTVRLWPWRANAFFTLVAGKACTFTNYITRVELDALPPPSKSLCNSARVTHNSAEKATRDIVDATLVFGDAMGQAHLARLAGVRSIAIRNVDWTTMAPAQQRLLRNRLAELAHVRRLEIIDATFHDLREVVRIVESFPKLECLKAGVVFTKYLDYAIGSAATLRLPDQLRSLELGTENSIPVVLTSLIAQGKSSSVQALTLKDVQAFDLPYIHSTLQQGGQIMQHVSIAFGWNRTEHISAGKHWHQSLKKQGLTQVLS